MTAETPVFKKIMFAVFTISLSNFISDFKERRKG